MVQLDCLEKVTACIGSANFDAFINNASFGTFIDTVDDLFDSKNNLSHGLIESIKQIKDKTEEKIRRQQGQQGFNDNMNKIIKFVIRKCQFEQGLEKLGQKFKKWHTARLKNRGLGQ